MFGGVGHGGNPGLNNPLSLARAAFGNEAMLISAMAIANVK
jgi:hypothetical protein